MYFLNTNYIYLRSHKDRDMKVIGGERMAVNQDAIYKIGRLGREHDHVQCRPAGRFD